MAVVDSKFLEVANFMFDPKRDSELTEISERHDVIEPRDTPIKKWQLQFVRFKCSILLASLLEQNNTSELKKRIFRVIPKENLELELMRQYDKYLKDYNDYGPKAFGHAEELPDNDSMLFIINYFSTY